MADGDPQLFQFYITKTEVYSREQNRKMGIIALHTKYFRREVGEQFTISVGINHHHHHHHHHHHRHFI